MAVQCSKCGEDLLGSVNRCWRCGHEFVSRTGPHDVPPVRRTPVKGPLEASLAAEVIEEHEASAAEEGDDSVGQSPQTEDRWSRRGSPFAAPGSAGGTETTAVETGPQLPEYPRNAAAIGGTVVAISLGVISFGLAFVFPLGALIVAIVGLVMGVWGVYSRRRGAAILGLLICCVAFAIAGFNGAVELYTYVNGTSPFETIVPVTIEE